MNSKGQKAGHYAFFYYSALLVFSFAVLLTSSLAVFPAEKANACYEPPAPVSLCPFEPQADRYIVDFDRTKKIVSSGALSDAFVSANTSIPDGQYKITLVASDAYPERVNVIQPNEKWYLILKDGSGVIGQTDSTSDLPDQVAAATTTDIVSESFDVSRSATIAVAFHSVYPDTTSANSVFPVCAVLDKIPPPAPITISASKIVCDNESALPNWGNGGPDITADTAVSYAGGSCHLVPDWDFQWAPGDTSNPGDGASEASSPWRTFGPTNENGVATTSLIQSELNETSQIWVREVPKLGYLGFTHSTDQSNVSAEMYCHTDVLNYDNYDYISNPVSGQTYYCVAFNVLAATPENTPPVITIIGANPITIIVGNSYTDLGATAADAEDGNITSQIVATSTVNTAVVGTYTVTYNVSDSDGLAAVPALRTVIVNPVLPAPFCGDGICNGSESCGICSDCGSCSYGGGGGGGSVPIGNGPPEFGPTPPVVNTPMVLGVSTTTETAPMQCNYLLEYLKLGANNNPVEVYKLQIFLKNFEGFTDLRVTGFFDQTTFDAVSVFQKKYRQDVLEPWGDKVTTGYVYITTKKKVNEIYCRREFPLTDLQKQEIIDFRNIVNSLKTQGVTVPEAEAEEIFGGIGQAEEGQEGFSTSTLAVGINLIELQNVAPSAEEKNGFQKGAFSAALAYFSGLELLPSLLLFFLLFATTSLLLLLRKCKRERIYTPTVLPFGDE